MNQCTQCKKEFEITDADREFYAKINVPEPLWCPDCRQMSMWVFRNERNYYSRTCDLCKKAIISVYHPQRIKNVYCQKCWWSDAWDPKEYGKEFNPSRPFFEQYRELLEKVPKISMMNDDTITSQNCEYCYDFAYGKNCYMMTGSWKVENCMYGVMNCDVKDSVDNSILDNCEYVYENAACDKNYACQHCVQCTNDTNVIFGYDLKNCNDCIACAGLRNKQYCIFNEQYSKEEYEKKRTELRLETWSGREKVKKEFAKFIIKIPRRYAHFVNCEDCTGDNLFRSKNAKDSFSFLGLENCRYMTKGDGGKDCYDIVHTGGPERCYWSVTPDNSYEEFFVVFCWKSQWVMYSENCHTSENLLGCVGLKKSKFCILNKEYSESEYKVLKEKIIDGLKERGEWGQFFPNSTSLFAYNESIAVFHYPLEKEQALLYGYSWADDLPGTRGKETVFWDAVADSIRDIDDGIAKEIFACKECGKNYKMIPLEFKFYKQQNIPLPRFCPDCRFVKRSNLMNPYHLWHRQCMCEKSDHDHTSRCTMEFETSYAPERPELIYCEQCYQKEMA
ncbi:hypothetical protein HY732_04600 [Candidatus Uhrbacteria bacterium]|nr:hypothetical protein [Candidatus Uhrbacteria bacterium]